MKKGVPCENWTRTVGYFANFSNVNPGKKAEIRERKLAHINTPKYQEKILDKSVTV